MSKSTDKLRSALKTAIFLVPCAYAFNFWYAISQNQVGGTFGDTFGAANALFSGLALMMLVYAVVLQRDELDIVREERDSTRKLLDGQSEITRLQKEAIERQLFEQSFFSVLALINQEKSRLLEVNPNSARHSLQIERVSNACEALLTNFAMTFQVDASAADLDLIADRAYNYVNLLTSAVSMCGKKCDPSFNSEYYLSMINGVVDYHTAVCFAWYYANVVKTNSPLAQAYVTLSINETLSPTLRQYIQSIEQHVAKA